MSKTKQRSSAKGRRGNPGALPLHGKLPIPWVTRRVGEAEEVMSGVRLLTGWDEDGKRAQEIDAPHLYRDQLGFYWLPARTAMDGAPQFKQVHPERQRRCMEEMRCQVCGRRCTGSRPARWVLAGQRPPLPPLPEGESIKTEHPPVCSKCLAMTMEKCPHLRRLGPPVLTAAQVVMWGALGDVYAPDPDGALRAVAQRTMAADDPIKGMALARQRIVELREWEPVDAAT